MILTIYGIILIVAALNLVLENRRDLMMMQQNSYRNERYMRWLRESGDTTSMVRLCSYGAMLMMLAVFSVAMLSMLLTLAVSAVSSYKLLTARYKKPLVMTARARRIFGVQTAVYVAALAGVAVTWLGKTPAASGTEGVEMLLYTATAVTLALYCLSHVVIYLSIMILAPVEAMINRKYYDEAARILGSMPGLKVIGITGSYGKTSTKHYLHRILSEQFDTCMTPGSFNTTLGVIRTVREYLKPYNEVFIVEMGAKQNGDIKEICDLVHPTAGIVTAVGEQHLESFKTIENVQKTKFELIDALPEGGLAVLNNDFPMIASRPTEGRGPEVARYAVKETGDAQYTVSDIDYQPTGTDFTINGPDGLSMRLHTKLVGECNLSNLTAAVIVALKLGMSAEKIKYAVSKIEQVEHRLQVKHTPGGITILDDAFNSNPHGSGMALDVLAMMKGGKRIIITPGMIELGEKQNELNRAFGEKIAKSADVAIVVGRYNREAIVEGIEAGGFAGRGGRLFTADTFGEAQALLGTMVEKGDTVLYENDLPDTFK